MDNRVREGYEYSYRISTTNDNTMITDEVVRRFRPNLLIGINTFLFEFRTNFILRKTSSSGVAAADDSEILLDSEKFCVDYRGKGNESFPEGVMISRLKEYWMLEDEIRKLAREAFDFANRLPPKRKHGIPLRDRVTPVIVEIEVRTVQQEGEVLGAAMDRAIRVDSLLPLFIFEGIDDPDIGWNLKNYLVEVLPRQRVLVQADVDEGGLIMSLMETCPICLRNPTVGSQISTLPRCKHVFHYHCLSGWLVKNNSCPLCRERVYKFSSMNLTQEELDKIQEIVNTHSLLIAEEYHN